MAEDDECSCRFPVECHGDGKLACRNRYDCVCSCGCEEDCCGCANCEGRDEDFEEDDARECIGPACLNPHFIHVRSECFTVEDCEAMEQESERRGEVMDQQGREKWECDCGGPSCGDAECYCAEQWGRELWLCCWMVAAEDLLVGEQSFGTLAARWIRETVQMSR